MTFNLAALPAGPPPPLSDYEDAGGESLTSELESRTSTSSKRIRFVEEPEAEESAEKAAAGPKVDSVQKKMLAMSGQDVDAYMKEMEEVHKKTEAEKAADLRTRMARLESSQPGPPGEHNILPMYFTHWVL